MSTSTPQLEATIGVAWLEDDKTIVMRLRAADDLGTVAYGTLRYALGHPMYVGVMDHLGGLSPGEPKPVKIRVSE